MKNTKQDPRNALKQTLVGISLAKGAETRKLFACFLRLAEIVEIQKFTRSNSSNNLNIMKHFHTK